MGLGYVFDNVAGTHQADGISGVDVASEHNVHGLLECLLESVLARSRSTCFTPASVCFFGDKCADECGFTLSGALFSSQLLETCKQNAACCNLKS